MRQREKDREGKKGWRGGVSPKYKAPSNGGGGVVGEEVQSDEMHSGLPLTEV